jgi:hypothetical protein
VFFVEEQEEKICREEKEKGVQDRVRAGNLLLLTL